MLTILDRYLQRRAEVRALRTYGWDGKCTCGAWLHVSGAQCVRVEPVSLADTGGPERWIYECSCGAQTRWLVGVAPVPLRENASAMEARRVETPQAAPSRSDESATAEGRDAKER